MRITFIPIWFVFVGAIVIAMFAIEAGYLVGQARHRLQAAEMESPVSAIANAILGLASFLLAFTFGLVSDRHMSRRTLVRDDAIAIRTAWQRSDFLPEADRAEAAALLRQYVDRRVSFAEAGRLEPDDAKNLLAETQRLQDRLWSMAVANARKDMNSDVAALYIDALNQVNAIHTTRMAVEFQMRMPKSIWLVLCFITFLGALSLGYQTGIAGSARSLGQITLSLAFALAFALIASLDRPDSRIISASQQPLIDLHSAMNVAAESPDRG